MSWEQDLRFGREAISTSQFEVAEVRLRSALATASGEFWYPVEELAEIQTALAEALLMKGCYPEAKQLFEQSEDYFGKAVDPVDGICRTMNWYGLAEIHIQQPESREMALAFFKKAATTLRLCTGYRQLFFKRASAFIDGLADKPLLPWEKAETERSQELRQITESISVSGELPQAEIDRLVEWEKLLEQSGNCLARETPEDTLEAYKLANQALELAMTLFPMHHTASALTMTAMATASGALRMLQQAEDLHSFAIEILEMLEGKDSVEVALARLNLAHLYRKAEMYNEADIHFRDAAAILNENADVDQDQFQQHASLFCDMLAAWKSLRQACLHIQQGKELELAQKFDEALVSYSQARRSLLERFPTYHNSCLLVEESIKQVYEKLGWTEQAEKLSGEIDALKLILDAQDNAWNKVMAAAPRLAIAKKAA